MDSPAPSTVTVRGKDLPGAVMVMPLGLDAAIKKRVSGEFKSEKSGSSLTFANVSGGGGNSSSFQQQQQQSSNFSSHMSSSSSGMSAAKQMSSSNHVSSSSQMSSSMMTNQQRSFQQTTSSTASKQVSGGFQDFSLANHGEEIKQSGLKDQLYSAITDLESEIDPEFKENISSNLMKSPTPIKSPHQQESFSPTPPSKHEYFSPPPLEPVSKPEPVSFSIAEPVSVPMEPVRNQMAPIQQQFEEPVSLIQNGFSDYSQDVTDFNSFNSNIDSSFMSSKKQESSFMSSQKQETSFMSSQKQESSFMSSQKQEPVFLGSENSYSASKQESFSSSSTLQRGIQEADSGSHLHGSGSHLQLQESDSNSSLLQKIMTPANPDYDSSSLKRRDPRKMYTDSSFYNKNHPSVADQVEMAHKLTSALFKDKAYLNRMKKSGEESDTDDFSGPKRDAVPNMKLVMNPEGKLHEWNDMDPSELPNAALMASHASAAPSLPSPDIINPMIEDLNSNTGRGETFVHRPNSFVSAYRRVFDSNRGVFGTKTSSNNIDSNIDNNKTSVNQAKGGKKDNDKCIKSGQAIPPVKDNWVNKDIPKSSKSLLPTWGTIKKYQNNGKNSRTQSIDIPKDIENIKPKNMRLNENAPKNSLDVQGKKTIEPRQVNKVLYTSPLERKSIKTNSNEVVKISTANAFVSPTLQKKIWSPSTPASSVRSVASVRSPSLTNIAVQTTSAGTTSSRSYNTKTTSVSNTFTSVPKTTSVFNTSTSVSKPLASSSTPSTKSSTPSSTTTTQSSTVLSKPATPSSILKKGNINTSIPSTHSIQDKNSINISDRDVHGVMDAFVEKHFKPITKANAAIEANTKYRKEQDTNSKLGKNNVHKQMDDFVASNFKEDTQIKSPTGSSIMKKSHPNTSPPDKGEICYKATAIVTPRVKRKVSIKADVKPTVINHVSIKKSDTVDHRKNEVTITPITPARHKKVMVNTEHKRFQSTPDISAHSQAMAHVSIENQLAMSQLGSPASRRRMPLSTTNQNIVSFFENKHKVADPFSAGHSQRSSSASRKSRQSEIPKGAAFLDFQPEKSNRNKELGLSYVPTTCQVAKTKAMFEGKENHLPIQKSRTFSSFPTDYTFGEEPLTPSPPQRSSSRKVIADFQARSLTTNLDQCGTDYGSCSGVYSSQDFGSSSASTTLDRLENPPNLKKSQVKSNSNTTRSNPQNETGSLENKSNSRVSLNVKETSNNVAMPNVEINDKIKEEKSAIIGSNEVLSNDSEGLDSPALNRRPLRDFFR